MAEIGAEVEVPQEDRITRNESPSLRGRVASIDALRGLTIFLMIFVNDLGRSAPPGCTTSGRRTPMA